MTSPPRVSSLSLTDAVTRARQLATSSVREAFGPRQLEPLDDSGGTIVACDDRSAPPRGTPVNWSDVYEVSGLRATPSLIDTLGDVLDAQGWRRKYGSARDSEKAWQDKDGFTIVFTVNDTRVSISIESPCVKPADPDRPNELPTALRTN